MSIEEINSSLEQIRNQKEYLFKDHSIYLSNIEEEKDFLNKSNSFILFFLRKFTLKKIDLLSEEAEKIFDEYTYLDFLDNYLVKKLS